MISVKSSYTTSYTKKENKVSLKKKLFSDDFCKIDNQIRLGPSLHVNS